MTIVDICSPSHMHAAQAIAAAEAGKHLLVEKPMALSMAENRALRDAVARAGVKSNVGFVLRWHPQTRIPPVAAALGGDRRAVLRRGRLLARHRSFASRLAGVPRPRPPAAAPCCWAVATPWTLLRYLVGDEVVEVSAISNNKKGLFEYDANVVALCKFRGGIVAKTSVLFDCTMPYTFNIDFAGTEGTLRDNRLWSPRLLPGQTGWATIPTTMIDSADVHRHPFDDEINDLVRAIRQGGETDCSVADAYRSHELCLAIDRSFAARRRPGQAAAGRIGEHSDIHDEKAHGPPRDRTSCRRVCQPAAVAVLATCRRRRARRRLRHLGDGPLRGGLVLRQRGHGRLGLPVEPDRSRRTWGKSRPARWPTGRTWTATGRRIRPTPSITSGSVRCWTRPAIVTWW